MKKMLRTPISAAALLSLAVACAPAPPPVAVEPSPSTTPIETPAPEAPYTTIPPQQFLAGRKIVPLEPRKAGLVMLSELTKEAEGLSNASLEIEEPTPQSAIVRVSAIGLTDDSLRGMRYRLKFENANGNWKLLEAGSQTQCQPGRGHGDWAADVCS